MQASPDIFTTILDGGPYVLATVVAYFYRNEREDRKRAEQRAEQAISARIEDSKQTEKFFRELYEKAVDHSDGSD